MIKLTPRVFECIKKPPYFREQKCFSWIASKSDENILDANEKLFISVMHSNLIYHYSAELSVLAQFMPNRPKITDGRPATTAGHKDNGEMLSQLS